MPVVGGWDDGDFDLSGFVDDVDLTILAGNWQNGVPPAGAAGLVGSVPEPASALVLVLGFAGLIRRRISR